MIRRCIVFVMFGAVLSSNAPASSYPVERVILSNGISLVIVEKTDVPLVAVGVSIQAGSLEDLPGREGTSYMLADMLGASAANVPRDGAQIAFHADRDGIWGAASVLTEDFERVVENFARAVRNPPLGQAEFEAAKVRAVRKLESVEDADPREVIDEFGKQWLLRHELVGRPAGGTQKSLDAIRVGDVIRHHTNYVQPTRTTVVVVGDVDRRDVEEAVQAAFADWMPTRDDKPVGIVQRPRAPQSRVLLIDKPGATQAYFWLGTVIVAETVDDKASHIVGDVILGGNFGSILTNELRVKAGLTYSARSQLSSLGGFQIASLASFAEAERLGQALDITYRALATFRSFELPLNVVAGAKQYALGRRALELETNEQIAFSIARNSLGHTIDFENDLGAAIAAVDHEDVKRAAQGMLSREATLVVIGDAQVNRAVLSRYGSVTEVKLGEAVWGN